MLSTKMTLSKTKSTEQLNLRVPKELLEDLDSISSILNVNRSEWIKIKLGELVYSEKTRLIEQYAELKGKGVADKKIIGKLMR